MTGSSVPPQTKVALLVTEFYSFKPILMEACFYGTHILKLGLCYVFLYLFIYSRSLKSVKLYIV